MEDTTAGASGAEPTPEPASGPVSGTPSTARRLLPRVQRDTVIAFVNETLDAVDLLAEKLADAVGLRGPKTTSGPPAPPPPEPPPPPPAPSPAAAPPPPPPAASAF
ncbi:MAG TPA: hypothetical protein VFJ74_14030 [Gemmatimonadaceae bacterium]|nr:hypothetical protein [Gemmatimonadaceae bacterium]